MKTVTTKQAQERLAGRGIVVSYPTIAQWVREGRFEGAAREETERGPVWRIPVKSVDSFEAPKAGRPKTSTNGTATNRAAKKGGTR
jgi:hypothetical protein